MAVLQLRPLSQQLYSQCSKDVQVFSKLSVEGLLIRPVRQDKILWHGENNFPTLDVLRSVQSFDVESEGDLV